MPQFVFCPIQFSLGVLECLRVIIIEVKNQALIEIGEEEKILRKAFRISIFGSVAEIWLLSPMQCSKR